MFCPDNVLVWSKWVKEELSMSWDKTLFPHLHPDWPARLHSPLLPDCEGGVLCFIFTFCWVLHPLINDLLWLFFSTVAHTVNMVNAMECYVVHEERELFWASPRCSLNMLVTCVWDVDTKNRLHQPKLFGRTHARMHTHVHTHTRTQPHTHAHKRTHAHTHTHTATSRPERAPFHLLKPVFELTTNNTPNTSGVLYLIVHQTWKGRTFPTLSHTEMSSGYTSNFCLRDTDTDKSESFTLNN